MLELVEGPTLADRIAKGPIPLDEALPIAKQIAEALEAARRVREGLGSGSGGAWLGGRGVANVSYGPLD